MEIFWTSFITISVIICCVALRKALHFSGLCFFICKSETCSQWIPWPFPFVSLCSLAVVCLSCPEFHGTHSKEVQLFSASWPRGKAEKDTATRSWLGEWGFFRAMDFVLYPSCSKKEQECFKWVYDVSCFTKGHSGCKVESKLEGEVEGRAQIRSWLKSSCMKGWWCGWGLWQKR